MFDFQGVLASSSALLEDISGSHNNVQFGMVSNMGLVVDPGADTPKYYASYLDITIRRFSLVNSGAWVTPGINFESGVQGSVVLEDANYDGNTGDGSGGLIYLYNVDPSWTLYNSVVIRNASISNSIQSFSGSDPMISFYGVTAPYILLENIRCVDNTGGDFGTCLGFGKQTSLNATVRYARLSISLFFAL